MKALHLASFSGNIGDNANHSGFRPWFESVVNRKITWTDLEIREFYWKDRKFDQSFVKFVSQFDVFIVGGGNYFELWVDDSATGTSIDISPNILDQIEIPIFFNALGCDAGQGASDSAVRKFTLFLKKITSSDQYLVTVRNDGAMSTLHRYISSDILHNIHKVPDGGFFLQYSKSQVSINKKPTRLVGINLASDMPDIRFVKFGENGYEKFCDEFANMLDSIAESDSQIQYIFLPHIFRDLGIISDILFRLSDRLRRTRVSVAPYLSGHDGMKHVFGLYHQCDIVLGMRFHANVCAMGMHLPVIGLYNYPQIKNLYNEVGFDDGYVDVRYSGFAEKLSKRILDFFQLGKRYSKAEEISGNIIEERKHFEPILTAWLDLNGLRR